MTDEQRSQPTTGPATPDDIQNYQVGGVFGLMVRMLKNGWPYDVKFNAGVTFGGAWTTVAAYTNGYTGNVEYRKIGDIVYLRGIANGGTIGLVAFTLPTGFRPPAGVQTPLCFGGSYAQINSDGTVPINVYAQVAFDGYLFSTI